MTRMTTPVIAIIAIVAMTSFATAKEYGAPMPRDGETVSLATAIARLEEADSFEGKIRGRVTEVCRKKGCFMILADAEHYARVTFKDYGFFIPTDTHNADSVVFGRLEARTVSREQAAHFAADAGRNPDDAMAMREYSIVANSVELD